MLHPREQRRDAVAAVPRAASARRWSTATSGGCDSRCSCSCPCCLGFATYQQARPKVDVPVQLRSIHPAPPGQITFRGKTLSLAGLENPLRTRGAMAGASRDGQRMYYQNCVAVPRRPARRAGALRARLQPRTRELRRQRDDRPAHRELRVLARRERRPGPAARRHAVELRDAGVGELPHRRRDLVGDAVSSTIRRDGSRAAGKQRRMGRHGRRDDDAALSAAVSALLARRVADRACRAGRAAAAKPCTTSGAPAVTVSRAPATGARRAHAAATSRLHEGRLQDPRDGQRRAPDRRRPAPRRSKSACPGRRCRSGSRDSAMPDAATSSRTSRASPPSSAVRRRNASTSARRLELGRDDRRRARARSRSSSAQVPRRAGTRQRQVGADAEGRLSAPDSRRRPHRELEVPRRQQRRSDLRAAAHGARWHADAVASPTRWSTS